MEEGFGVAEVDFGGVCLGVLEFVILFFLGGGGREVGTYHC